MADIGAKIGIDGEKRFRNELKQLTQQGKTLSDVLRSGIMNEATRSGIMEKGKIADRFRARISAYRQVLEAEAQTKRSTEK